MNKSVELDRAGLTFGIFCRDVRGEAMCVATFLFASHRDDVLTCLTSKTTNVYFAGEVGNTK